MDDCDGEEDNEEDDEDDEDEDDDNGDEISYSPIKKNVRNRTRENYSPNLSDWLVKLICFIRIIDIIFFYLCNTYKFINVLNLNLIFFIVKRLEIIVTCLR